MKRSVLFFVCLAVMAQVNAQPGKTPVTKAAVNPLKNLSDSASYAVGMSVAAFYKQQGITKLNSAMVSKAISDVLGNKTPLFDDVTANNVLNNYMMMLQAAKSKPRIDSGIAFLAKNKLKPGVKTTASGLQYEVITEGTGARLALEDTFVVNYRGTLLNGFEFDASFRFGVDRTATVNRFAECVDHAADKLFADRNFGDTAGPFNRITFFDHVGFAEQGGADVVFFEV